MRKVIAVSIPEPCHENWETMTPQEKGRHCNVCEKIVYDFTNKTDEQIVKTFEDNGKLCGRFKTNQLNRELVLARKSKNSYRSIAASGLFAFLALNTFKSKAQNETILPKTEITKPINHVKGKIATSVLKERVISGTILDENNLPLPGANIVIKGTSSGTQTDFDGHFKLKVDEDSILIISFVGYETKEVIVSKINGINLSLTLDQDIMGEIIITPYCNSEYTPTPEEIAEEKRQYQFRIANNKAFYKRKRKEEKAAKKLKRQEKRNRS